jgi:hypothetical protein
MTLLLSVQRCLLAKGALFPGGGPPAHQTRANRLGCCYRKLVADILDVLLI